MRECLDTSVIVKWFKENERLEDEANFIKDKITSLEMDAVINALEFIDGLIELSAIKLVKVSNVKELALKLQIDHGLHTGDAVHLATAIFTKSSYLWADDKHFMRQNIIKTAKKHGVEIKDLRDLKK